MVFNITSVEIGKWLINYIPLFGQGAIIYPCHISNYGFDNPVSNRGRSLMITGDLYFVRKEDGWVMEFIMTNVSDAIWEVYLPSFQSMSNAYALCSV